MFNFAFDIGGSNTRVIHSNCKEGVVVKRPSVFATIPLNAPIIEEIGVKADDVIIYKEGEEPVRVLKGEAINSYVSEVNYITHVEFKVENPGVYYNIIYHIAKTFLNTPVTEDDIRVGICLPPVEVFGGYADEFKKKLAGLYKVEFPYMPDRNVEFVIKEQNIMVQPEGVCARQQIDPALYSQFKMLTLVVDAGYRSTDIVLMANSKPIKKFAPSYPHGGHNLETNIMLKLNKMQIYASKTEVQQSISTGILQGQDITPIINDAKAIIANVIYDDIVSMIGGLPEYALQGVKNILFVGRSFEEAENSNIKSLSQLLLRRLPWMTGLYVSNLEEANVLGVYASMLKWK
jgi:hypothetical protein